MRGTRHHHLPDRFFGGSLYGTSTSILCTRAFHGGVSGYNRAIPRRASATRYLYIHTHTLRIVIMGLLTRCLRRSALRLMSAIFCTPELLPSKSERPLVVRGGGASSRVMTSASSSSRDMGSSRKMGLKGEDSSSPEEEGGGGGELAVVAEEQQDDEESKLEEEASTTMELDARTRCIIQSLTSLSVLFDLFDLANCVLDIIFAVRLSQLPDAKVYAVMQILGVLLGRVVLYRGTWLLFRGGIEIDETMREILKARSPFSDKNIVALQLLYCLAYAESASFLLEKYPCLATYAFWRTINFPPSPLEKIDSVNVILAIVLGLSIAIFLSSTTLSVSAWHEYLRFKYASEHWSNKVYHGCRLGLGAVLVAAVASFLYQIVYLAWKVAVFDESSLPNGSLLWGLITLCEDVENFEERLSFCDEQAFLVKSALAWTLAAYFSFFLFFRPAQSMVEEADAGDKDSDDDSIGVSMVAEPTLKDGPDRDHTSTTTNTDWADDSNVGLGNRRVSVRFAVADAAATHNPATPISLTRNSATSSRAAPIPVTPASQQVLAATTTGPTGIRGSPSPANAQQSADSEEPSDSATQIARQV